MNDEVKKESQLLLMIGADDLKNIFEDVAKKIILELKQDTPVLDEFLTTEQVCKLLKVSRGTIINWRAAGKLESHKIGQRILFKREEILAKINRIKVYKSEGELM